MTWLVVGIVLAIVIVLALGLGLGYGLPQTTTTTNNTNGSGASVPIVGPDRALVRMNEELRASLAPTPAQVVIVSLAHSQERRTRMKQQLDDAGTPHTLLAAVYGRNLDLPYLRQVGVLKWGHKQCNVSHMTPQSRNCGTPGEIGTYLSHALLWHHFLDMSKHPFIVVLEDDAIVPPGANFLSSVQALVDATPSDPSWDVLYIGTNPKFCVVPSTQANTIAKIPEQGRVILKARQKDVCGTFGYVISRQGAQKLLARAFPITHPVDVFMRNERSNTVQLVVSPPLVTHDYDMPSTIEETDDAFFERLAVRIGIVVKFFNAMPYFKQCMKSIMDQTNLPGIAVHVCTIDDGSDVPPPYELLDTYTTWFDKKPGWQWTHVRHPENRGGMQSVITGLNTVGEGKDDIIVVLDGDDYFAHSHVLKRILQEYTAHPDVQVTYGSFERTSTGKKGCASMCPDWAKVVATNGYRQAPWVFSHPKTFRYGLYQQIPPQMLAGDPRAGADDMRLMFPLLELAAGKASYIPDVLYKYRDNNPLSFHMTPEKRAKQLASEKAVRKLTPLLPLTTFVVPVSTSTFGHKKVWAWTPVTLSARQSLQLSVARLHIAPYAHVVRVTPANVWQWAPTLPAGFGHLSLPEQGKLVKDAILQRHGDQGLWLESTLVVLRCSPPLELETVAVPALDLLDEVPISYLLNDKDHEFTTYILKSRENARSTWHSL